MTSINLIHHGEPVSDDAVVEPMSGRDLKEFIASVWEQATRAVLDAMPAAPSSENAALLAALADIRAAIGAPRVTIRRVERDLQGKIVATVDRESVE